ncbi:MAG: GTPase [Candidatus Pacearchaeota archaeon]
MPINAHPEYFAAEKAYLEAQSDEERILCLEEMIRKAPHHKGSENLLAQLKTRLKKLREKINKGKKSRKGKAGIKKSDMQTILIGFTNSGKSSILNTITNANSISNSSQFTTNSPVIGTLDYKGLQIQIIDLPSLKNENFDIGIVNTTDTIIEVITNINELPLIEKYIEKSRAKKLIVFNKSDLLSENEKRKVKAFLETKKYNFVIISAYTEEGVDEFKEKLAGSFNILRIYLKEPGKQPTNKPMIMKPGATVKDVAEKIKWGLSNKIRETRVTGPSSKFPNQKVGLNHEVKDKDIVEFKTG